MALEDDNMQLARRIYDEVFTGGDLALLDEILAEDVVEHEAGLGVTPDRDGVKQFFAQTRAAFPDLKAEVHDMLASGDRVVARVRFSGTHRGEFAGIPATNRTVGVEAIDILRVQDGKVAEHWGVMDQLAMLQQLGVVQTPGG